MSEQPSISTLRREYRHGTLQRSQLSASPIAQFERWLQQANDDSLQDATAMTVATVDSRGMPYQRMVLLKGVDDRGFVFFTNLGSRKAQQIEANQQISLHFAWLPHDRQVIINGHAEPLSTAENMRYFLSRPKESQLAALASHQSHPITARRVLEEKYLQLKQQFSQGHVEAPKFWGGYRIKPETVEFWQGGEHRLHDRFMYQRPAGDLGHAEEAWHIERWSP